MKLKIIITLIICIMTISNNNIAQTVYFPAGNKAYEKCGSIITFFKNNIPVRRIDMKNNTDTDLINQQLFFLWTSMDVVFKTDYTFLGPEIVVAYEKKDSVITYYENAKPVRYIDLRAHTDTDLKLQRKTYIGEDAIKSINEQNLIERRYNNLGLLVNENSNKANNGNGNIYRFDKYGSPIIPAKYNKYGNIVEDMNYKYIYDEDQQLIRLERYDGTNISEVSYNILDSLGRTKIFYTYDNIDQMVLQYKEIEYIGNSMQASKIYKFDLNSALSDFIYITETVWHSPLRKDDIDQRVSIVQEQVNKFTIDDIKKLIEQIRNGEYRNKPDWVFTRETTYKSPLRISRICNIYNYPNKKSIQLTEFKFDELDRWKEQIVYANGDSTKVESRYTYTYDVKSYNKIDKSEDLYENIYE